MEVSDQASLPVSAQASNAPTEEIATDGAAAIAPEDVATTIRVLKHLAGDADLFFSKGMQPIRRAIAPLSKMQGERMYDGLTPAQYKEKVSTRQARNRQKQQLQQLDREYLAKTQLRAKRIEKLNELAQQADAAGLSSLPLIPDGAVDLPAAPHSRLALADATNDAKSPVEDTSLPPASSAAAVVVEGLVVASPPAATYGGVKRSAEEAGLHDSAEAYAEGVKLNRFRACYICKRRYLELHHFYDALCPACAAINWQHRHQEVDLTGRVALVTGARVKIGFQCVVKLLRCGAAVIATTRFPHDAAKRFAALPDFASWKERLHIYGVDFRHILQLEAFCAMVLSNYPRLDIIINNACQTVRRPPSYFKHLMPEESLSLEALPHHIQPVLGPYHAFVEGKVGLLAAPAAPSSADAGSIHPATTPDASAGAVVVSAPAPMSGGGGILRSAAASQLALVPGDDAADATLFPEGILPNFAGLVDVNMQQIDLRSTNSWVLKMHEISTPELAEVFAINAIAPFILNARLKPLMLKGRALPSEWRRHAPSNGAPADRGYCTLPERVMREREGDGKSASHRSSSGPQSSLLGEIAAPLRAELCRFIVNVSAMEGKFNRSKLPTHPHTNMAKAALNMMTRTSAQDYADTAIFMTAVDTGWINDENPLERAARTASANNFQTPIDEIDAAARILHPVFAPLAEAQSLARESGDPLCCPLYGAFLKDYCVSEW